MRFITQKKDNKVYWVLIVNNESYKDIACDKTDLEIAFDLIEQNLQKDNMLFTTENYYKFLTKKFPNATVKVIKEILNYEKTLLNTLLDNADIYNYKIPIEYNKTLKDLSKGSKLENCVTISSFLIKMFLFYSQKENTHNIQHLNSLPLFLDLKKLKMLPQNAEIEDLFALIEEKFMAT